MEKYKIVYHKNGDISHIETSLTGNVLLNKSKLNKGCAFTQDEREQFHLIGLLPYQVETLDQQVARMYEQYNEHQSNLGKNIYLNVLHDYNETLFYKLISQHLEEILNNRLPRYVNLSVVTDGEAVLGIGDQGMGGINISIAKLMVYTLGGGIDPHHVLPIQLDVGTNNPHLLNDPMYLGWRHERVSGEAYDDFIDTFVRVFCKKFPHALLHWEDVGRENARRILNRYREHICTVNGDIQATGVVALACILAGVAAS